MSGVGRLTSRAPRLVWALGGVAIVAGVATFLLFDSAIGVVSRARERAAEEEAVVHQLLDVCDADMLRVSARISMDLDAYSRAETGPGQPPVFPAELERLRTGVITPDPADVQVLNVCTRLGRQMDKLAALQRLTG